MNYMQTSQLHMTGGRAGGALQSSRIASVLVIVVAMVVSATLHTAAHAATTTNTVTQATQARQAADADQQASLGNYAEASRRYEALAAQTVNAAKDHFLLKAAWFATQTNDPGRAQSLLDATSKSLSGSDAALRNAVGAAIALRGNQPDRALNLLDQIVLPLPDELTADILQLRTQVLFASGRVVLAVNAALERERVLKSTVELQQNRQLIWNGLKQAATAGRDLTPPPGANRAVAGWLELARLFASSQRDPFVFNRAVNEWRTRYPAHPASELVGLTPTTPVMVTRNAGGDHLALLLPLSGKQQAAGIAVRDGFLAALLQQPENTRPAIQIYNTATGAVDVYKRAVNEGANFVIGPLLKEDVQALAATQEVSVATLALNSLADSPTETQTAPAAMFQFALDPEDEARQVVMRARAEGHTRAIALVPNNDWGQRMQRAFLAELQAEGSTLVEIRNYDASARDYVQLVKQLLAPRKSAQTKALDTALGNAQKMPERRDDFDFVFLAAQSAQAKQLRPALRFNMPDNSVPIYGTSDAYEPESSANTDLDGLRFTDMPWVINRDPQTDALHANINRYWPSNLRGRSRLYAFGADAFQLIEYLKSARPQLATPLRGMSGLLAVDQSGHVRRQLDWAQIVNGQPQLLPDAFTSTAIK
jgi:outer membrane PBP1 activator LpoA protein